jgi:hypothetical protein
MFPIPHSETESDRARPIDYICEDGRFLVSTRSFFYIRFDQTPIRFSALKEASILDKEAEKALII